jgi:hypothetical protein
VLLSLALGAWFASGSPAFAKGGGGGGHGGGGHGGGHGGGGRGHHSGGYHHYGYHNGGTFYGGNGYYNNGYYYYSPNTYYTYPSYGYVTPYSSSAGVTAVPIQGRFLGIDEQAVVDSGGPGMQVLRVYSQSPAEQAGLKVGDVIHSINGYQMERSGNIAWMIANTPSNGVLQLSVRPVGSLTDHLVSAMIP